jgi:hypothetical protein
MKNLIKVFGIIALVAVIGLTMLACNKSGSSSGSDNSKSSGGGGKTLNSPEALKEYLDKQPANSPDKPIKVSMTINDPMLKSVVDVIKSAGKYVSLNITGNALTNIPKKAFESCETLVNITIPNSVTSIGDSAFDSCTNLASVTIPNSVTSIGYSAFGSCKNITSVTIPNSVTNIGAGAFSDCTSLITINVDAGNTVYSSQDGILYNNDKTILVEYPLGKTSSTFTIPNSITNIGDYAFFGAKITNITIPNSVNRIGVGAFAGTNLISVTIPNSVTSIEDRAFSGCDSLTNVTIGSGVERIEMYAFDCSNLANITFQGKINHINYDAFHHYAGRNIPSYGVIGTYIRTSERDWEGYPVWKKQ